MAKICKKCGTEIGFFSKMDLELSDGINLCYDCAEPIQSNITKLYGAKTIEEFDQIKEVIIEKSQDVYDESICSLINSLINKILSESSYIKDEGISDYIAKQQMMTTGYDFTGYKIKKYIGIISGQVVLGTGFLSEISASYADFFGAQSNKFATKLEQAKNAALGKLSDKSIKMGGNAIIGVDFDYITFHGNLIGVVANGTSVVVEEEI